MLEEAFPVSTDDVVGGLVGGPGALIPDVTKDRFNVNVMIESNDLLFQFRSDSLANLSAVDLWLQGSNNLDGVYVPSPRLQRAVRLPAAAHPVRAAGPADARWPTTNGFEFAARINPELHHGHGLRGPA